MADLLSARASFARTRLPTTGTPDLIPLRWPHPDAARVRHKVVMQAPAASRHLGVALLSLEG